MFPYSEHYAYIISHTSDMTQEGYYTRNISLECCAYRYNYHNYMLSNYNLGKKRNKSRMRKTTNIEFDYEEELKNMGLDILGHYTTVDYGPLAHLSASELRNFIAGVTYSSQLRIKLLCIDYKEVMQVNSLSSSITIEIPKGV